MSAFASLCAKAGLSCGQVAGLLGIPGDLAQEYYAGTLPTPGKIIATLERLAAEREAEFLRKPSVFPDPLDDDDPDDDEQLEHSPSPSM